MTYSSTYQERIADGVCVRCGKREPEEGSVACVPCKERLSANRTGPASKSGSDSFNDCCQAHGFHRDGCKGPSSEKRDVDPLGGVLLDWEMPELGGEG